MFVTKDFPFSCLIFSTLHWMRRRKDLTSVEIPLVAFGI